MLHSAMCFLNNSEITGAVTNKKHLLCGVVLDCFFSSVCAPDMNITQMMCLNQRCAVTIPNDQIYYFHLTDDKNMKKEKKIPHTPVKCPPWH